MRLGNVQAEGGYTFSRATSQRANTLGELLVRIGLGNHLELRVEPGSYSWVTSSTGSQSGREDGELGVKLRVHDATEDRPSPVPAVALIFASSVPTGGTVFRERRPQPEVKFATEWTLTHRLGLGTNLDFARPVDNDQRYTEFAASASLGFDMAHGVGAFFEVFGFAPEISGAKRTGYFDTGMTASLSADLQVDLRGGVGLNGAGPDYFVGVGVVRRW